MPAVLQACSMNAPLTSCAILPEIITSAPSLLSPIATFSASPPQEVIGRRMPTLSRLRMSSGTVLIKISHTSMPIHKILFI